MTIPTSPFQLAFYLALLVPGVVFAAARVRLRGPRAADRSVAARVLEAVVASAVFDAVYALALAAEIGRAIADPHRYVATHIAECASVFLILGVVTPYVVAWAIFGKVPWLEFVSTAWRRVRGRLTLSQEDAETPTAWDFATRGASEGWIRIRIAEQVWVGGVWDERCRYSTYPEERDIFIAEQWRLGPDGAFREKVELTQGLWIRIRDEYVVEWLFDKEFVNGF